MLAHAWGLTSIIHRSAHPGVCWKSRSLSPSFTLRWWKKKEKDATKRPTTISGASARWKLMILSKGHSGLSDQNYTCVFLRAPLDYCCYGKSSDVTVMCEIIMHVSRFVSVYPRLIQLELDVHLLTTFMMMSYDTAKKLGGGWSGPSSVCIMQEQDKLSWLHTVALQVAVTHQEAQRWTNKDSEEEETRKRGRKQASMQMRKETHSTVC